MTALSWDDLFIDAVHLDFANMLSVWPGIDLGRFRPIGASAFGDLFIEQASGSVLKLDVLEGRVEEVASSMQEFADRMNTREWQEIHLLSEGIALLKERGLERATTQFFGFAPHPALSGRIDWSTVMPLDAIVWHGICAQAITLSATPSPR